MKVNLKMKMINSLIKLFGFYNYIQPNSSNVLTSTEMKLLAVFCDLPEKYKYARFSIPAKKKVISIYKELYGETLSGVNLNNKLYCLLDKGFLYRDEDKVIYLKPFLQKAIEELYASKKLELTVVLNVEDS